MDEQSEENPGRGDSVYRYGVPTTLGPFPIGDGLEFCSRTPTFRLRPGRRFLLTIRRRNGL
jgi:hypothetical protein